MTSVEAIKALKTGETPLEPSIGLSAAPLLGWTLPPTTLATPAARGRLVGPFSGEPEVTNHGMSVTSADNAVPETGQEERNRRSRAETGDQAPRGVPGTSAHRSYQRLLTKRATQRDREESRALQPVLRRHPESPPRRGIGVV